VMLAKAFLGSPRLVLLDEPTASLDPEIACEVRQFIKAKKGRGGTAMLYTSHNMAEVSELCDRVVFLSAGKVFASDTPQNFMQRAGDTTLRLWCEGEDAQKIRSMLMHLSIDVRLEKDFVEFCCSESAHSEVLRTLSAKGVSFKKIEIMRPSLEDYFLRVAGGTL
jgi:ABC-2 type transport system ATP-binding protein